jgi:predicted regulator of Ras-like GTPase activity (Roadblock/LC7/MglB family)
MFKKKRPQYLKCGMFEDILSKFIILDGVSSVTIIRDNGEVIISRKTGDFDDRRLAAVISFILEESKSMASKLGKEPLSMVFIEFRDHILLSAPLKDNVFIVLIANPGANIAQINMELKKNRELLSLAL